MIKRELKTFEWVYYEDGEIQLINKKLRDKDGDFYCVTIPMSAIDSLMRALITFKTKYTVDQMRKLRLKKKGKKK